MMAWLVKQVNSKHKGFTLIEMVIVVAIIAILIAIAVPQVLKQINKSKIEADKANAKNIATAIQQWVSEGNVLNDTGNNWVTIKDKDPVSTGNGIVDYLGSGLPKTKLKNGDFYYKYDATNQVLRIGAENSNGTVVELYPSPDPSYK
ncbi:prepilin-type N-terminal cleavage/methylation domain-containing protein [Anaerocellum danielii]|uniref:Prepilin-type N-terminal cleavage/methylation domain-containing protein n=1 Tax=Anaerocellum danielii TaxID=1387557 RepID=A0ABZ0TX56_9FIRM|nr:prepilin-type N-terminal cleavage/methylation domain-containing protein [Caldicellulosiruptor danielii]WPX08022.1 prepilin-type N-terminal cleavage/methylation domain-containing protein [Caldicellulosiruptor danielii]